MKTLLKILGLLFFGALTLGFGMCSFFGGTAVLLSSGSSWQILILVAAGAGIAYISGKCFSKIWKSMNSAASTTHKSDNGDQQ